jgi:hypothetical protein
MILISFPNTPSNCATLPHRTCIRKYCYVAGFAISLLPLSKNVIYPTLNNQNINGRSRMDPKAATAPKLAPPQTFCLQQHPLVANPTRKNHRIAHAIVNNSRPAPSPQPNRPAAINVSESKWPLERGRPHFQASTSARDESDSDGKQ